MCKEWMWSELISARRRHMFEEPTVVRCSVCAAWEVALLWLTAYISWLKCLKETILMSSWATTVSSVCDCFEFLPIMSWWTDTVNYSHLTPIITIKFTFVFRDLIITMGICNFHFFFLSKQWTPQTSIHMLLDSICPLEPEEQIAALPSSVN